MERVSSFFDSSNVSMETLKSIFEQSPQQPPSFVDEVSSRLQLSFTKRIIAFLGFFGLGVAFLFFATFSIFSPHSFAKLYTFGNLFILGSTFFLVGPMRQIKSMCAPGRWLSSSIYFVAMFATLYAALSLESLILTLVMMIVQVSAAVWYGASYIPFAQDCLRGSAGAILPV